MIVWTDAHLAPALAPWLRATFGVEAAPLRELGLRDAEDAAIFAAARVAGAVLMTKDGDFVDLVARYGPPPQIVWLTCGNTTNAALRRASRSSSAPGSRWSRSVGVSNRDDG